MRGSINFYGVRPSLKSQGVGGSFYLFGFAPGHHRLYFINTCIDFTLSSSSRHTISNMTRMFGF